MNAHVMLFKCPKCYYPLPAVRLEIQPHYRSEYTDRDRVDVACMNPECEWRGSILALAADRRFDTEWLLEPQGQKFVPEPSHK